MNKIILLTSFSFFLLFNTNGIYAQKVAKKIIETAKQTADQKAEQKTAEGVSSGIDKGLNGIKSIFKKKNKGSKKDKNKKEQDEVENVMDETSETDSLNTREPETVTPFGVYTNFTFEPGNKILYFDDFSKDKLGDFPLNWETNGSGEVVTNSLYEGNWFSVLGSNGYVPLTGELPDNYTIEFDLATSSLPENRSGMSLTLYFLNKKSYSAGSAGGDAHFGFAMTLGRTMSVGNTGAENTQRMQTNLSRKFIPDAKVHFSIAVNKKRLRVWMNEDKIIDNPSLLVGNMGRFLLIETYKVDPESGLVALLSNIKFAEAAEDMRSQLLDKGRFSTTGIYFNTDKADIKPESFAIIKSVADYLKENPDVKVQIIGHTDAQGEDEYNQQLSEKRAQAVVQALAEQFAIDISRLSAAGKGETEPVDDNATEKGRANNRRVEFIKR